jgi:hypothetical protein
MTDKALNCSFYGNAFYAPRSISKNRKVLVVIARVNHTDKSCLFFVRPLRSEARSLKTLLLADRHWWTRCVIARRKRVVP